MTKPVVTVRLGSQVPHEEPIELDLFYSGNLLMAGSTGAGKSVAVRKMISDIATSQTPSTARLILIDPKMGVEFGLFNDLPHLLFPVIDDPSSVPAVLQHLSSEIDRRYQLFRQTDCRDLLEYRQNNKEMPMLILVVEELADLLMTQPKCTDAIIQLAQKGRAAGLVIVLVTQRPSADILPGLLMANIMSRACFRVANQVNSRLVLDQGGADQLKDPGDFLYRSPTQVEVLHGRTELISTETIQIAVNQAQKRFALVAPKRLPAPKSNCRNMKASSVRLFSRLHPVGLALLYVLSTIVILLKHVFDTLVDICEWVLSEISQWCRKRIRRANSHYRSSSGRRSWW